RPRLRQKLMHIGIWGTHSKSRTQIQIMILVVIPQREPDLSFFDREAGCNGLSPSADLLICHGLAQRNISCRRGQPDVAVFIRIDLICSREVHCDLRWVSRGCYAEIELQLLLFAAYRQVHARVRVAVLYASVMWHFGAPFFGIIPKKVVAGASLAIGGRELNILVCSVELHSHYCRLLHRNTLGFVWRGRRQ